MPRLSGALTGITAAVVGVILNLTLWFGLHVMFARVGKWTAVPLDMSWPAWASFDWLTVPLVGIAAVLLLRFHAGVPVTLAVSAGLGMVFILSGL